MVNKIYLSVIIPVFDEERHLPEALPEIDKYLKNQDYNYEIVVVNDGSTDRTAEFVKNLKFKIANLKLIDNKEHRGKGYAVNQGMLRAEGKYRLFTDADNSTSIEQVEKMWPYFQAGFDIVIGSRDVRGAVLDPPQSWLRKVLLGEGFKVYRKIVIGLWGIEDTQCGFKGFTKEAVKDIFPGCKIKGFAFDPEVLVIAKKLGYKIKEIPVYWKNNLESRVKFKNIIKMTIGLLKIRWNLITQR